TAWRGARDFSGPVGGNIATSIPPRRGKWRFRTARRVDGRAKSGDQRLESKFERRVPFRFLEVARNAREPRAVRDDVSVVDGFGEQMALAAEVVIDAHRLDAERVAQLSDAERRQTVALDQRKSRRHDPVAAERRAPRASHTSLTGLFAVRSGGFFRHRHSR